MWWDSLELRNSNQLFLTDFCFLVSDAALYQAEYSDASCDLTVCCESDFLISFCWKTGGEVKI